MQTPSTARFVDGHDDPIQSTACCHVSVERVRQRWLTRLLDWLDRHWDDAELRSGFWRIGS